MKGVDHTLQTDVTDLESQISQLEEQHGHCAPVWPSRGCRGSGAEGHYRRGDV
jgi:hypothetical protein